MKYVTNVRHALGEVYEQKRYVLITAIVAFVIFSFNGLVVNYDLLFNLFSFKLLGTLLGGIFTYMRVSTLVFLIVMSLMAGILLSMSIFLVKRQMSNSVGASSSSILLSFIAPACPSCAIGLLGTLGVGSFLTVLPFRGLELGVISIIVMAISIVYLSGKVVSKTCSVTGLLDS